jgi:hypothetical protein
MIPIYEQGGGRGIGHNLRSFIDRFTEICDRHAQDGDSPFALLFYDFRDHALREILEDPGYSPPWTAWPGPGWASSSSTRRTAPGWWTPSMATS